MNDYTVVAKFREGDICDSVMDINQRDRNIILQIEGLSLPDPVEVHFSLTEYDGEAPVSIGRTVDGVTTVEIPEFILENENEEACVIGGVYRAYAFVYVTDGESGRTERKIVFHIKARPKPTTEVPEPKQDPFLEEVRQVMAETKEIAQSVREDADKGKFDGPQGPKGDAGAIKFKIVPTLPTEDISESTIYMVPLSEGSENNEYAEYVFVNGKPEYIGSATVAVDLSEYVKNTDYATGDKAGLVQMAKWNSYGLYMANDGKIIAISKATNEEIDEKVSGFKPIVPSNLDYAVKKALSDCKLTGDDVWTDEEKAKALELLGVILEHNLSTPWTVVKRGAYGVIVTGTPTQDTHATTKKYVDDLVTSAKDSIALKDASTGQVYNVRINNGTLEMVLVDEEVE